MTPIGRKMGTYMCLLLTILKTWNGTNLNKTERTQYFIETKRNEFKMERNGTKRNISDIFVETERNEF